MPNLNDYIRWRGDLTLAQSPWLALDSLAMACLSYVNLHEAAAQPIALRDIHDPNKFDDRLVNRFFIKCRTLFDALAASNRYGDILLHDYVDLLDEEGVKQFSAVTGDLADGTRVIAFRGTDSTLVGWREDFRMAYDSHLPAQLEACEYLARIAAQTDAPLRLVGHSKGGNLAAYAAAWAAEDIQGRILSIESFDGPGLDDETMSGEGYARIRDRISSVVPQDSIVGLLLSFHTAYRVVKSRANFAMQHDVFTWELDGPAFAETESVSKASQLLADTLHDWLKTCAPEERKLFVDTVFDALQSTNMKSFAEMSEEKLRSMSAILNATRGVNAKTMLTFLRLFHDFIRIGAGNVLERLRGDAGAN